MAVNWTLALKIILWLWYWFNSIYVSFSLHKSSISILMRPKQCRPILLLTSLSVSRQAPLPPRGPGHRGRVRGGRGRGGQQPRPLRHRGRAARHHLPLGAQHQHRPHQPRAAQVKYFLLIWYFLTKLIFYRFHLRAGLRRCHWPSTRSGDDLPSSHVTDSSLPASILRFSDTRTELGEAQCWASNPVGEAASPCVFKLVAAGKALIGTKLCNMTNMESLNCFTLKQPRPWAGCGVSQQYRGSSCPFQLSWGVWQSD